MNSLIFHQLFERESSTYTYLLADEETREAILIDPVLEMVDRDMKLISELGLNLTLVLDTHVHADHVTAAGAIRDLRKNQTKTGVSRFAGVACSDVPLDDGQIIRFGEFALQVIATPGHTDSCVTFHLPSRDGEPGMLFTGDALLIRGNGRTDFQQGSSDTLFDSVVGKLFSLPEDTKVFPAHDYNGQTSSTIAIEKRHNPRLGGGRTKAQFKKIMSELKLALPGKIHEALPANMSCGNRGAMFQKRMENGIPEVAAEDLATAMTKPEWKTRPMRLIDVRRADEYNAEFGHVAGAELVTLGPDLQKLIDDGDPNESIVFICRSGGRSGQATGYAESKGFKNVYNMQGGMIRWTELKLPSVKN